MHLECCDKNRKARLYELIPDGSCLQAYVYHLEKCPKCKHSVVLLRKYLHNGMVREFRFKNTKATKFLDKIKHSIADEIFDVKIGSSSNYYLWFNEYGMRKKCFSNFSTLKLGIFDDHYEQVQSNKNNIRWNKV